MGRVFGCLDYFVEIVLRKFCGNGCLWLVVLLFVVVLIVGFVIVLCFLVFIFLVCYLRGGCGILVCGFELYD